MSKTLGYKVPLVLEIQPKIKKSFPEYNGFFNDVKTVSTIEEGVKSFDDLKEQNKIRRKPRNFEYK